jgi:hypothetical protein
LSPSAFKNVAPVGLRRGDRAGGPLPAGAIELPHFEAKYGGRVRPLWSPIWSLAEVFRDMVRRPCEYVHGGRRSDPRRAAQDVNADGGLDRPEIIGFELLLRNREAEVAAAEDAARALGGSQAAKKAGATARAGLKVRRRPIRRSRLGMTRFRASR